MLKWTSLSFVNREWRMPILAKHIEDSINVELVDGTHILLKKDNSIIECLKSQDLKKFNLIKEQLCDVNGNKVKLSELGKTLVFGGLGIGNSREMLEQRVIKKLNDEIVPIAPIIISANQKWIFDVVGARKSKQHVRSDIELFNSDDESVIWISHKSGKTAEDFQQWSGVKQLMQHAEVKNFIWSVNYWLEKHNNNIQGTILTRHIYDNNLKLQSVYGMEYNSQYYGVHNVNCVIQGDITLKKSNADNVYKLSSINSDEHIHYNGALLTCTYEPMFYARYDSKAHVTSKLHLYKTRILIFPKGRIKGKNVIKI